MSNRSELFSILQNFFQEIKTQFGVPIHALCSDNAKEYLSNKFQNFVAFHNILHPTPFAHTP